MKKFFSYQLYFALIPFVGSIPFGILNIVGFNEWLGVIGTPLIVVLILALLRNKLEARICLRSTCFALMLCNIAFLIMAIIAKGNVEGALMLHYCWFIFPFLPIMLLPILMNELILLYFLANLSYLAMYIFCFIKLKEDIKKALLPLLVVTISVAGSTYLYLNRPAARYGGHGFEYMHGYSSTDFSDYMVYADNSKLVALDHEPSITFDNVDDMPILDGAEACYPMYASFAKAVYKDIDQIEKSALNTDYDAHNGRIVTFTNTIYGFERLTLDLDHVNHVDIFFGAKPSEYQMKIMDVAEAETQVEIDITPIGKEAFVFFVEADNPVDGLTVQQLKAIYHGDITNWKELGGKDQEIIAFQRPENSGSQTIMQEFMGDVTLKEPLSYEVIDAMGGVLKRVAQYANEEGAIGYSFRYFLEELNQEKGVKVLSVDGIYPTLENIENGTYPIITDLCMMTRKDCGPNVEKMKEFILSEDGQFIIRETGYGKLGKE